MIILASLIIILLLIKGGQLLFERRAAERLSLELTLDQNRLTPDQTLTLSFSMSNPKLRILPSVTLTVSYPALFEVVGEPEINNETGKSAQRQLTLTTTLLSFQKKSRTIRFRALSRGYGEFRVSSELSDLLGSVVIDGPQSRLVPCVVHPQGTPEVFDELLCGLQGKTVIRRWLQPDPLFFTGVRPYQSQDSFKDIDWRASARLNSFQVKQYDATADPAFSIFLWVQPGRNEFTEDPGFVEDAVRLGAGLIELCRKRQLPAALLTNSVIKIQTGSTAIADSSPNHLIRCLDILACTTPYPRFPAERLAAQAASLLSPDHHCLFIVNQVTPPLCELAHSLTARRTAVTVFCRELPEGLSLPRTVTVIPLKGGTPG